MENVIKGLFAKATPTQNELCDALWDVIKKYEGHVTMCGMVGILEMIKADVLDSMVKK